MPSRLPQLEKWYRVALESGYQFFSIEKYWDLTEAGKVAPPAKSIVLRHDVDVDLPAARALFALEKSLGIFGSYYFRLNTLDRALMQEVARAGGEVGYHYEEIATEAKANRWRSAAEVIASMPLITNRFQKNLERVRALTGLPIVTAAAHGDWLNRWLKVPNTEMLKDPQVRALCGLRIEAYDQELLTWVTARYADAPCPSWWSVGQLKHNGASGTGAGEKSIPTPMAAVQAGLPVLYVLLHPEQWRRGPVCQFNNQARRVAEGITYHWGQSIQPVPAGQSGPVLTGNR